MIFIPRHNSVRVKRFIAVAAAILVCLFAQCVIACDLTPKTTSHCPQHQPDRTACEDTAGSFDAVQFEFPPPVFNSVPAPACSLLTVLSSHQALRTDRTAPPHLRI
jgi:hypothetical protein